MAAGYEQFYDDFSRALAGQKPLYLSGVDLGKHVPSSANKHLLENAALALSTPSRAADVLDWLDWYSTRPLHENEETTSSESYRPAIDFPTLALAGFAQDHGQTELRDVLLDRCRASISDLLLSLGCAPPRIVRDEGVPGKRGIQVGDGNQTPLPGNGSMPVIVGVGKRGYVRADTAHGNLGPFHYLYQRAQAVMVCQMLGLAYKESAFDHFPQDFANILRRWPSMRRWGFSPADLQTAKRYYDDCTNPSTALQVHLWAAQFPSNEGRLRIRGTDRAIESLAVKTGDSSTGAVAINCQRADGVTFRTSSDTGTRYPQDIHPQRAWADASGLHCVWDHDPGSQMNVARVVKTEAWRSLVQPGASEFSHGGGEPVPIPPQPQPPEPTPTDGPLVYLGPAGPGESLYGSKNPKLIVREIHPDGGWPKRWIAETKP